MIWFQSKKNENVTERKRTSKKGVFGVWKRMVTILMAVLSVCMLSSCGKKETGKADIDTDIEKNETLPEGMTEGVLYVDFINVGKGDCAILRFGNTTYMIDTGYEETATDVLAFLEQKKIKKIDGMIITHFDKDHVGGATQILDKYEVGTIYMPDYEGEGNKYKKFKKYLNQNQLEDSVQKVTEDIQIEAEGVQIEIYAPHQDSYIEENDYSLITKIVNGEDSFLFAADAEEVRIEEMLGNPVLDVDVLKVPYHGILGMNNIQFIDEVSPSYSIITSDKEEDVSTSIIYELEQIGSAYYFNCNGNISCNSDGNGTILFEQN